MTFLFSIAYSHNITIDLSWKQIADLLGNSAFEFFDWLCYKNKYEQAYELYKKIIPDNVSKRIEYLQIIIKNADVDLFQKILTDLCTPSSELCKSQAESIQQYFSFDKYVLENPELRLPSYIDGFIKRYRKTLIYVYIQV